MNRIVTTKFRFYQNEESSGQNLKVGSRFLDNYFDGTKTMKTQYTILMKETL